MGYDLHITRAADWSDNDACRISEAEWLALVDADPELSVDPENSGYFNWRGPSSYPHPWFHWFKGNISTKNPDKPIVVKMLDLARLLNARVQGDDGEIYEDASEFPEVVPEVRGGHDLLATAQTGEGPTKVASKRWRYYVVVFLLMTPTLMALRMLMHGVPQDQDAWTDNVERTLLFVVPYMAVQGLLDLRRRRRTQKVVRSLTDVGSGASRR